MNRGKEGPCARKHLGYVCGLPVGHRYLHEARSVQGKLMHAWSTMPRPPKKAPR